MKIISHSQELHLKGKLLLNANILKIHDLFPLSLNLPQHAYFRIVLKQRNREWVGVFFLSTYPQYVIFLLKRLSEAYFNFIKQYTNIHLQACTYLFWLLQLILITLNILLHVLCIYKTSTFTILGSYYLKQSLQLTSFKMKYQV